MQISELAIEVGDDHSGYGADENLIDHDSQAEAEQHRQTFICRPQEQLRGLISSGWNACFFHGFDNRYFKKIARDNFERGVKSFFSSKKQDLLLAMSKTGDPSRFRS